MRRLGFVTVCCSLAAWGLFAAESPPGSARQLVLLASGSLEERTAAARWLGLHLVTEAAEPLVQQWRAAPRDAAHEEFRRTVEVMLELLRRPRDLEFHSVEAVLQALEDPAAHVRASAVRHLAYYAPDGAVALAAEGLAAPDDLVREEAIRTLARLGDRNHATQVSELLEDPGGAIRLRALEYLLQLDRPDLLPRLVTIAADANPWIAQPAVRALQQDGRGPDAAAAIFEKLRGEPRAEVVTRYLVALERFESRDGWPGPWRDNVRPLLRHSDGTVRRAAAALIGESDPKVAHEVWVGLLDSDDAASRLDAARALATAKQPVDQNRIERLLDDGEVAVRVAALDLASGLSPARRRSLLRKVLERSDEDNDVLSRALAGLAEVGRAEDVGFLIDRARGTDSEHVRINAVLTLAALERKWETTAGREWFREQLADPAVDRATRHAVVRGLQVAGDPSFLPLLADELRGVADGDSEYARTLAQTMSVLVGRRVHGREFGAAGLQ